MKPDRLEPWGRYPPTDQVGRRPAWEREIGPSFDSAVAEFEHTLAYGNGRSYGDTCIAAPEHAIDMRGLDRFIETDWDSGIVRAQAGLLLGELIRIALPRGWFPPVTPGTQFVTLGGAVANDVHGKNHHHAGTFGHYVTRMGLSRTDTGYQELTRESAPRLFAATVGGLGLTGIITWVELRLKPIAGDRLATRTSRFRCHEEFLELSSERDVDNEYSVAWIDCLAPKSQLGRGLLTTANHEPGGTLKPARPGYRTIPMTPPVSLVTRATARLFNLITYHRPRRLDVRASQDYDSFFYPLDRIHHWNRIYGRSGFQQFQCLLPEENSAPALRELLELVRASRTGSFLAVLKRCEDWPAAGMLSFPRGGISLALDFPQQGWHTDRLLANLDCVVEEAGGRLYPAKDAHMAGSFFRSTYPAWEAVERLRDPGIMSKFWKRVTQ